MTVLVGVKCSDGIVIGADSKATSAHGHAHLVQVQSNDKLQLVGPKGILATTGSVGLSQRLKLIADAQWGAKGFRGEAMSCFKGLAGAAVKDFQSTGVPRTNEQGWGFGAMLGMIVGDEPYLVEFATTDLQPEIKQGRLFGVSMGGGQILADPFLAFVSRVLWEGAEPDVNLGKIGVYWVLNHTIQHAPGGVGEPIMLGVIKRDDTGEWAASVSDDTQEQAEYIAALEAGICPKEPVEAAVQSDVPVAG